MKNMNSMDLHNEQAKKRRRRKWYYTVSLTMAAIVVFCTVYALILPAITMEKQQQELSCALDIHQHTESCYDAVGNLICGEADYVIHSHDNKCFDANGKQVCMLPKLVAHKHGSSCYNNKHELICGLPEVEEHKHNELCYDKDGTLICGKLQTIKHVHGTACFKSSGMSRMSGSTNDEAAENDISPQSDTARAAILGEECGYNSDGSIWWGGLSDTQFGADEIKENTPYLISGYKGNNLMADETFTKGAATYLKAIPKSQMTDFTQYERWYFEKTNEDGKYCIYFLKTNEDGSTTPLYLKFAGYGVEEWGHPTQQTALTNDKTQATVFTVAKCTDGNYPDHITASAIVDGKTFYINSYFGDKPESNGNTTHWLGYEEYSEGSFLRVSQYNPNIDNTAKRVSTDTSTNSVINLFDYWLTPNRYDFDGKDPKDDGCDLLYTGINNGHDFKFTMGTRVGNDILNQWTGTKELPRQGMVSPTLVNKYPVLSGKSEINGTTSTESLNYVFNPDITHEGKASYKNVGGLLTLDGEGYYSYDCNKNMAEFDEESNYIRLYDKPGVTGSGDKGQFFPFNKAPQIMTAGRTDTAINHYFGMTITTRFVQQHDGYTDERKNQPTSFHFSGDDDVWIFIDDVLVGDVGGIHDAASIDIDFTTGEVKVAVAGVNNPKTVTTNIRECYEKAGKDNDKLWILNPKTNTYTFANNTMHTLKFFYLERGNYASNLSLKFNLTEIPTTAIEKTDEYGKPVPNTKFAIYAAAGLKEDDTIYNMLDKKGGTVVDLSREDHYAENGDILDSSGNVLANALYLGTTDSEGRLKLLDEDGMPYSIDELEEKFGKKFILREIEAPEGYRMVSVDNDLRIYQGERQKVLISDNAQVSGCRALTDLHTVATDTIYLREKNQDPNDQTPAVRAQQYCDPATGEPTGTMFAVVVKYTGKTIPGETEGERLIPDEDVKKLLTSTEYWTPLYGNDDEGYQLVDMNGKDLYTAAIEAAIEKVKFNEKKLNKEHKTEDVIAIKKYEGVTLQHQRNGNMELFMDDLAGHIRYYYNMLPTEKKNLTRYNVLYFWTNTSLENATSDNTFVVNTRPIDYPDEGIAYRGVDRTFSAVIDVPNLVNDVYVQKVDAKHNLLNGATFAMYQVEQQPDGQILYRADDGSYIPLPEPTTQPTTEPAEEPTTEPAEEPTTEPAATTATEPTTEPATEPTTEVGVIEVGDKTIRPYDKGETHTFDDGVHTGSVRFVNIPQGQYIIKEVKAPPGYKINTTDIMFLVTDYKVYANAGTVDDGVIVGHGPGYLVSPMHPLAAEDDINNTLTWVHAQMSITKTSTSFADAGDDSKLIGYLTKQNSSETTDGIEEEDSSQAFKTYLKYTKGKSGTAYNYTPDLDRYEDKNPENKRRIFTTSGWSKYDIYQDYEYGKPKAEAKNADYYNWSENNSTITNLFSRSTYIRVTDEKGDVALKPEKVDSSNKKVKLSGAQFRLYRLNSDGEKEYYVKKVDVPQDPTVSTEPTVSENPTVSTEPTTSTEPTVSEEKKYVESVSWSKEAAEAFVVTTGDDGLSTKPTSPDPEDQKMAPTPNFTGLIDGTYYLEEIKPPVGYYKPPNPVKLTIALQDMKLDPPSGCSISKEADKEGKTTYIYTITVPNSTGYELPSTGGSGTFMYTVGGILLVAISLVYGYRRKRRSERRFK